MKNTLLNVFLRKNQGFASKVLGNQFLAILIMVGPDLRFCFLGNCHAAADRYRPCG
jgi:hypothetical protein